MTAAGTEWAVERVARVVDGDTVRLVRSRTVEIDGRRYRISDADTGGVPIRLVWVDTPERGQPGYYEAREDLRDWVLNLTNDHITGVRAGGPLRVVCYESGGFDRLLGDLIDVDGNSASQWLMAERGWPPYVKGK